MTLLDLFALALATSALVAAWLHKDGLFAECLLKIEAWGDYVPSDLVEGAPRLWPWIKHKIAFGLLCKKCLSFHIAFWLAVIFWIPSLWYTNPIIMLPVYSLAATQLALWLNESLQDI
jgi:hypothetical protein